MPNKPLRELVSIKKGKQLNIEHMVLGGTFLVLNGGITPSGYTNDWNTEANTITISEGGNSCGYVSLVKQRFWSGGHNYTLNDCKIDKHYLYQYLKHKERQIMALRVGSGLPNIQMRSLVDFEVPILNEKEHYRIGSFLSAIDRLIEKHREKLDRIKSLKKGYLQKMFPTLFELTPQLRFTSFKSNWQQGLISDLLTERIEIESKSNTYPLMSFVSGRGVVPKSDRYNREFLVSDVEGKDYKKTEFGDFIYSSNNLETGSIGLNSHGKATISPVYSIFYPSLKTTSTFIGRLLLRKPFIYQMLRFRQGVVYGQWRIHEKHFLKIPILYPTRDEQLLVGTFFDRIDALISKEEAFIEPYESLKKGYLQRIFAD